MAKIAVDIDSTLYDFESPAREAFTRLAEERNDKTLLRGAYHPWTEWRSPADACGIEAWLDAIDLCHDADMIRQQVPFTGAVETCQALMNEGHDLLYISSRKSETEEATRDWLREWNFMDDTSGELACVVPPAPKDPYMEDCQYLIDDRPKTVVDFIYDYKWTKLMEAAADRIRNMGPLSSDAPFYDEHFEAQDKALKAYYDDNTELKNFYLDEARKVAEKAADDYVSRTRRRAFVIAYPYNQALTDIPHLYLAPTWAGLNTYLVGKGVLSEPAARPLGMVIA